MCCDNGSQNRKSTVLCTLLVDLQAQQLNKEIFECIYYAALETSCELAEVEGPYETYAGSPMSKGVLQFDMWGVQPATDRCG